MRKCVDCDFCDCYGDKRYGQFCFKPWFFIQGDLPPGESWYEAPGGWKCELMRINRLYCGPEGMWYENSS